MNKKLILMSFCLMVIIPLQGCSTVKNITNKKSVNTTQETIAKANDVDFSTYKDLTDLGKKNTTIMSGILTKDGIPNIITPDNMYVVNKTTSYAKMDKIYNYQFTYMVAPNFNTGKGNEKLTLYQEKSPDELYSKDNDQLIAMVDVINKMTGIKKITIDDLVTKLNAGEQIVKHSATPYVIALDADKKVNIKIDYTRQDDTVVGSTTQLTISYIKPFKNYLDNAPKKYSTIKEYKDSDKLQNKVDAILLKDGITNANGMIGINGTIIAQGDTTYIAAVTSKDTQNKFSDNLYLQPRLKSYDITDVQKNVILLKPIYDILKTYSSASFTEQDLVNYVQSDLLYTKYYVRIGAIKDAVQRPIPPTRYYSLLTNVAHISDPDNNADLGENINIVYDDGTPKTEPNGEIVTKVQSPSVSFQVELSVPVVAAATTEAASNTSDTPHTDATTANIYGVQPIKISVVDLEKSYSDNEVRADKLYQSKPLEIIGKVKSIAVVSEGATVTLSNGQDSDLGIICTFKVQGDVDKISDLNKGDTLTIDGTCIGKSAAGLSFVDCTIK